MEIQIDKNYRNNNKNILCIGHSSIDINLSIEDNFIENRKYRSSNRIIESGGPAANAASLIAAWADPGCSYYAGPVGQDLFGETVAKVLSGAGVNCDFLQYIEGYPTPLSAVISNRKNGSRTIVNHREVDDVYLYPEEVDTIHWQAVLGDGHVPGAFRQFLESNSEVPSVLDAGSFHPGTEGLYSKVNYLIGSAVFAEHFCGRDLLNWTDTYRTAEEVLRRIGAGKQQFVAVTTGEKGVFFYDPDKGFGHCRAIDAIVADTTAAGDIFHGAFVFAIANNFSTADAVLLSTAASGLSVQRPGGLSSIPTLDETVHVMKTRMMQESHITMF